MNEFLIGKIITPKQAKENYIKDIDISVIINSFNKLIEKESLNRREIRLDFSYMDFYIFNIIKKYLDYEKISMHELILRKTPLQDLLYKDKLVLKDSNFINSLIVNKNIENLDFTHLYKCSSFNETIRPLNENYIQFFLEISPIFYNVFFTKTVECLDYIKNILINVLMYNCYFSHYIATVEFTKDKKINFLAFNFTIKW